MPKIIFRTFYTLKCILKFGYNKFNHSGVLSNVIIGNILKKERRQDLANILDIKKAYPS